MRRTRQPQTRRCYDIQKDSREIAGRLLADRDIVEVIPGRAIVQAESACVAIGRFFDLHAAVDHRKLHGTLDRQLRQPVEIELRNFLESVDVPRPAGRDTPIDGAGRPTGQAGAPGVGAATS